MAMILTTWVDIKKWHLMSSFSFTLTLTLTSFIFIVAPEFMGVPYINTYYWSRFRRASGYNHKTIYQIVCRKYPSFNEIHTHNIAVIVTTWVKIKELISVVLVSFYVIINTSLMVNFSIEDEYTWKYTSD